LGSLTWGCLAAIYERKFKRFIAYTSINQIGFLLLGLVINTPNTDGFKYTFLYLIAYAVMSFTMLLIFLQARPTPMYLTDFNALYRYSPFLGLVLVVVLFAMAGIPPLAGF
jgi:NADH-quinone oxidoreductase subunit N